jgi:hypothetical protein
MAIDIEGVHLSECDTPPSQAQLAAWRHLWMRLLIVSEQGVVERTEQPNRSQLPRGGRAHRRRGRGVRTEEVDTTTEGPGVWLPEPSPNQQSSADQAAATASIPVPAKEIGVNSTRARRRKSE